MFCSEHLLQEFRKKDKLIRRFQTLIRDIFSRGRDNYPSSKTDGEYAMNTMYVSCCQLLLKATPEWFKTQEITQMMLSAFTASLLSYVGGHTARILLTIGIDKAPRFEDEQVYELI